MKYAVVTGGTKGIGLGIVKVLLEEVFTCLRITLVIKNRQNGWDKS